MIISGASPSLYYIGDQQQPGYKETAGRTEVSPTLIGGQSTGVFLVIGDSMIGNFGVSNYTPAQSRCHQLNPYDGRVYELADPVLGPSGTAGSMIGRIANELRVAAMWDRVIMIPVGGIGGSWAAQWAPGGALVHKVDAALHFLARFGWSLTGVLCQIGPNDSAIGTSSASYQASITALQSRMIKQGYDVPWFIAKTTMVANVVNPTIQAAQTALWNSSANRFAGPDIDSLTGTTNRQGDGTHPTDACCASAAVLWKTSIDAVF